MATEFDTSLPSIRNLQKMIADKQEVEVKLITNDLHVGKIAWQDTECLCLLDQFDTPLIIWRQAIVYLKPKS
jgi:host factor-I protein